MKLFGRCKLAGECLCGLGAYYPANSTSVMKVTTFDAAGRPHVRYEIVPQWSPDPAE